LVPVNGLAPLAALATHKAHTCISKYGRTGALSTPGLCYH